VSEVVKYKSVSITVHPYRHSSGREYWRFKAAGRPISRSTLEKAKREALKHAQTLYRGNLDLTTLTPEQSRAVRRMIEADPECRLVDEFLLWSQRRAPRKPAREAVKEFLESKRSAKGSSPHNVRTLAQHLKLIPDMVLGDITPGDLPPLTGAPRSRRNVRSAWVTFFSWCRDREWLPYGEKTAPECLDRPIVTRKVPATYTPAELRVLLENVRPDYLPWLALGALAGIRTEEVIPQQGSDKSPLAWEDIDFRRKLITVRPETSKIGQRRVIPICTALAAWLRPVAGQGAIGPRLYPSKPLNARSTAETTRLGRLIGGWRRNALRHSFISYRAAIVGLAQTSMEAGNSESEARRSYNDAKSKTEARRWFGVLPKCYSKKLPADNPTRRKEVTKN
jgi:integrase